MLWDCSNGLAEFQPRVLNREISDKAFLCRCIGIELAKIELVPWSCNPGLGGCPASYVRVQAGSLSKAKGGIGLPFPTFILLPRGKKEDTP